MDRRVKERLIGAGLLVALAVVVVPELLSGPKPAAPAAELPRLPGSAPDPVRNVTVDLTTNSPAVLATPASQAPTSATPPADDAAAPGAAAPRAEVPHAEAPRAEAPRVSVPDVPAPRETPAGAPTAAPSQVHPVETAAAAPGSGAGFAVQLGVFANRSNADNLVHQLKAQGYAVYVSPEGAGKAARYRVRVGPLNDREAGQRTIARLKAQGHAATLIAPR